MTRARRLELRRTSTHLASGFDVIGVEDLTIRGMTRSAKGTIAAPARNVKAKAGLNRGILAAGWGVLVARLEHKAPGRVIKVDPAYTSQRCSRCGHVDADSRKNQALFVCTACGFVCNADVNAAMNIKMAAGRAVAAREELGVGWLEHREPQLLLPA